MDLIILGVGLVVCFIITWIVIATNAPGDSYAPPAILQMEPPYTIQETMKLREENGKLREQIYYLERTRCPIACMYKQQTCCHCESKVVYAKSPDEQKIVDLLKSATKPLDELKKEFGIK